MQVRGGVWNVDARLESVSGRHACRLIVSMGTWRAQGERVWVRGAWRGVRVWVRGAHAVGGWLLARAGWKRGRV